MEIELSSHKAQLPPHGLHALGWLGFAQCNLMPPVKTRTKDWAELISQLTTRIHNYRVP